MAAPRLRKIKGRYYAYFYDRHQSPKSKSYPLGVSNKDAAEKLLRRLESEYAEGTFDPWYPKAFPARRDKTLGEAVRAFLNSPSSRGRPRRPKTIETYEYVLRDFARHCDLPQTIRLNRVSARQLRSYVHDDKLVSDATRHARFRHLRTFFNWSVRQNYLKVNPLDEVGSPAVSKKARPFLRPHDIQRLLTYMKEEYPRSLKYGRAPDVTWIADIIQVAFTTGLRRGELWPEATRRVQSVRLTLPLHFASCSIPPR